MAKVNCVATPRLVSAIVQLVDLLPRGTAPDGTEYKGIRQDRSDIVPLFFQVMAMEKHPLAEVKNDGCTYDRPCGACRRDVFQSAVEQATASGKIVAVPHRGKKSVDERTNRVSYGKGFVIYYRADEYVARAGVGADFMDKLMARL